MDEADVADLFGKTDGFKAVSQSQPVAVAAAEDEEEDF